MHDRDSEQLASLESRQIDFSILDQVDPWIWPFVLVLWSAATFLGWTHEYATTGMLEGVWGSDTFRVFWFVAGFVFCQMFLLCLGFGYSRTRLSRRWIPLVVGWMGGLLMWFVASGGFRNGWRNWIETDQSLRMYLTFFFRRVGSNLNDRPIPTVLSFFASIFLFSWLLNSLLFGVRLWHPWRPSSTAANTLAIYNGVSVQQMVGGLAVLLVCFGFLTTPRSIFFETPLGDFSLLAFVLSALYGVIFFVSAMVRIRLVQVVLLLSLPMGVYGVFLYYRELFGESQHGEFGCFAYGFLSAHVFFVGMLLLSWSLPRRFLSPKENGELTNFDQPGIATKVRKRPLLGFSPVRIFTLLGLFLLGGHSLPLVFDVPVFISTDRSVDAALTVAKARRFNGGSFFVAPCWSNGFNSSSRQTVFYQLRSVPVLVVSEKLRRSPGGEIFDQADLHGELFWDRRYRVDSADLVATNVGRCISLDGSRLKPSDLSSAKTSLSVGHFDLADAKVDQEWLDIFDRHNASLAFRRCKFSVPFYDSGRFYNSIAIRETVVTEDVLRCFEKPEGLGGRIAVFIESEDQLQCSVRCVDLCQVCIAGNWKQVQAMIDKVWPGDDLEVVRGEAYCIVRRKTK